MPQVHDDYVNYDSVGYGLAKICSLSTFFYASWFSHDPANSCPVKICPATLTGFSQMVQHDLAKWQLYATVLCQTLNEAHIFQAT